ncbi:MAG: endo-1,4-beta-xylanase [Terracidiphilus sp.]
MKEIDSKEFNFTRREFQMGALAAGVLAALPSWARAGEAKSTSGAESLRAHAAARGLLYGIAVNPALLDVEGVANGRSGDGYTRLIREQANIMVAENAMKWEALRPSASVFDFTLADRLMRFAGLTGQLVRGHNLCWHADNPEWLKTEATKDNARLLLTQHIEAVAGRYRGRLHSWDVVNEAILGKDGRPDHLRKSLWVELIGPEYIDLAFQTAARVDPQAKLTYNDYDIELDTPEHKEKREHVLQLLRGMKARGVPIHALGVQSHIGTDPDQKYTGLVELIRACAQMGLEVYLTEMDLNTAKIPGGNDAQDAAVAQTCRNYLGAVLAEPNVKAALTWGIDYSMSWLNKAKFDWATRPDGALLRCLPFDDDHQPLPAFFAIREAFDRAPAHRA